MVTRTGEIAALVILAYFASTTIYAAPIFINAESGTTRPLDGTWEYGCVSPGPGLPDENEVIVFQDNNVEGQLITYTSMDGTCSSGGAITSLGSATVSSFEDFTTLGWLLSSGAAASPPIRLDGLVNLHHAPTVTKLEFNAVGAPAERLFYYLDDTAPPWCLYNSTGPVDPITGYQNYVLADERRCRVGAPPPPRPECDIWLNQTEYVNGSILTSNFFRFANLTDNAVAIEVKVWLELEGVPPISILNLGADGSYVLPAGADFDAGPIPLAVISAAWPRGEYEFSCRMLDPVTGELLAEDRNFFDIVDYSIGGPGPAGGTVFYLTADGQHGLEAAPFNQSFGRWGCAGTEITGADGVAIGTGAQNTADILAGCADLSMAAAVADRYTLNGYDDWFLPSLGELNEMYLNKEALGISSGRLWSSSEIDQFLAWSQWFDLGNPVNDVKNSSNSIRPVRAF